MMPSCLQANRRASKVQAGARSCTRPASSCLRTPGDGWRHQLLDAPEGLPALAGLVAGGLSYELRDVGFCGQRSSRWRSRESRANRDREAENKESGVHRRRVANGKWRYDCQGARGSR